MLKTLNLNKNCFPNRTFSSKPIWTTTVHYPFPSSSTSSISHRTLQSMNTLNMVFPFFICICFLYSFAQRSLIFINVLVFVLHSISARCAFDCKYIRHNSSTITLRIIITHTHTQRISSNKQHSSLPKLCVIWTIFSRLWNIYVFRDCLDLFSCIFKPHTTHPTFKQIVLFEYSHLLIFLWCPTPTQSYIQPILSHNLVGRRPYIFVVYYIFDICCLF